MKLSVSYGAMSTTELKNSPLPESTTLEATLQQLRKNSRWRKLVVGAFLLLGCAYAAILVFSDYDCPLNSMPSYRSGGGDTAYCKLAAWSNSVNLPRSSTWTLASSNVSSVLGMPGTPGTRIDRIVFGIAGSAASWAERKEIIKLWWKPGLTKGFVWVEQNLERWEEGDPPFKISEDTSRLSYTHPMHTRDSLRIARIVAESYRLHLPNVDWFVMGDDDTLFFPDNLVHVLSKYDHRKLHYIGCNSEDARQSQRHLHNLAFGGGGFAISYPLAKALSEMQDECLERYAGLYGSDERVKACVSEMGVPLTRESGFHQLDIHGDISGLLAAHPVSPVVSLHHLDAVEPIFYDMTNLEAAKRLMKAVNVSSANMFQQSICYDEAEHWSFVVAWGYVVEIYEGFLSPRELEIPATTFISWAWRREFDAFTIDTRPLAEVCSRPARFFMVDAQISGKSRKRVGISSYDKLTEFEGENCRAKRAPVDTVKTVRVESDPISEDWFQNPRRQCCSVKNMNSQSINIKVGACRETESLVARRKRTRRSLL